MKRRHEAAYVMIAGKGEGAVKQRFGEYQCSGGDQFALYANDSIVLLC
jgi:hypothetical protein